MASPHPEEEIIRTILYTNDCGFLQVASNPTARQDRFNDYLAYLDV